MFGLSKLKVGIKNTSYLVAGNVSGQLISMIFTIYIARKLGPSTFGIYSTVGAFVGMFGFLTFVGYQKVLIRESSGCTDKLQKLQEDINSVFALKSLLSCLAIGLAVISSFFVYEFQLVVLITIYSFTLIFNGTSSILQVVFHVHNKMKYLMYTALIRRLIYIVPAAICINFGGSVKSIIISFTLSTLFDVFVNYYFANKYFSFRLTLRCLTTLNFEKRFFRQAMVFSFLGFIGYFYSKIDITMLSWLVTQESVGTYSAGYKLIQPMEMVGMMAAVSFFPLTVERFKQNKPVKAQKLFFASLVIAVILIPVSLLITFFSKDIISLLYGDEYQGAHLVLRYLCWVIPLGLVNWPFILSMQANHHEKAFIIPNIMRAITNVILNYFFILKYGMIGVVYSTIVVYVLFFTFINIFMFYILKKHKNLC